jgi:hypothetical protein
LEKSQHHKKWCWLFSIREGKGGIIELNQRAVRLSLQEVDGNCNFFYHPIQPKTVGMKEHLLIEFYFIHKITSILFFI